MVDDSAVKAGQMVRFTEDHRRGTVREVDPQLVVVRVQLNTGGEVWALLDDVEIVEPWDIRRVIGGEQT